jgi:hypothetical protein
VDSFECSCDISWKRPARVAARYKRYPLLKYLFRKFPLADIVDEIAMKNVTEDRVKDLWKIIVRRPNVHRHIALMYAVRANWVWGCQEVYDVAQKSVPLRLIRPNIWMLIHSCRHAHDAAFFWILNHLPNRRSVFRDTAFGKDALNAAVQGKSDTIVSSVLDEGVIVGHESLRLALLVSTMSIFDRMLAYCLRHGVQVDYPALWRLGVSVGGQRALTYLTSRCEARLWFSAALGAAEGGWLEVLMHCMDEGDFQSVQNDVILFTAVEYDQLSCVQYLYQKGEGTVGMSQVIRWAHTHNAQLVYIWAADIIRG